MTDACVEGRSNAGADVYPSEFLCLIMQRQSSSSNGSSKCPVAPADLLTSPKCITSDSTSPSRGLGPAGALDAALAAASCSLLGPSYRTLMFVSVFCFFADEALAEATSASMSDRSPSSEKCAVRMLSALPPVLLVSSLASLSHSVSVAVSSDKTDDRPASGSDADDSPASSETLLCRCSLIAAEWCLRV